jgi:beta-phosphoglucomutase
MAIHAVIFDLDGVLVSTDEYHFQAWQQLAFKEGIYFDWEINQRLRGVSRMASLEIVLGRAERTYSIEEKARMADFKNAIYQNLLDELTPDAVLPGVIDLLDALRERHIKTAVCSSSKNASQILERTRLKQHFDAWVTGNDIQRSKPHPEGFLLAAQQLNIVPSHCLVVEDAVAGLVQVSAKTPMV